MWQSLIVILTFLQYITNIESCTTSDPQAEPRVIIVGGGAAGISALSRLLENGFTQVTLLEAENRIGGRVYTVPFASNFVDLGAQWVHGEDGNIIYQTVAKSGVLSQTPESYFEGQYINSQGQIKPEYDDLADISDNSETEIAKFKGSLGRFFTDKFWNKWKLPENQYIDKITANESLELFERLENFEDCSDSWFDTSATGYNEFEECDGYDLWNWKDKGYKTVFDFITVNFNFSIIYSSVLIFGQPLIF